MWTNTEQEITKGILNYGLDIIDYCVIDDQTLEQYKKYLDLELLKYPLPSTTFNHDNWFIPEQYKAFDIETFLLNKCDSDVKLNRVKQELELYKKHNMIIVLKAMKYIVDVLRENNIVWGVGRGSSCASYVLYLLDIHRIDSIKYNLDIFEFFKGEK